MAKQAKRERQKLNREARRQAELAAARRRRQWRTGRTIAIFAVPLVIVLIVVQLRSSGSGSSEPNRKFSKPPAQTLKPDTTYTATIDTSQGKMVVNLDAGAAPKSVNNFVFLARKHFYDGLTFHRVAKDFVIQGGDPKGDGSGDPGYKIQAETPPNGYQVGSVAWAKTQQEQPGTAGSQFFVVTSPAPSPGQGLDAINQQPYQYGILGSIAPDSLAVAQKIGALAPASGDGKPTKKVTINKVTIAEAPSSTAGSTTPAAPPSS
ncbi:MAG TPA: peptidylprolyl isomerase [Acidimicrobiia bacterium]